MNLAGKCLLRSMLSTMKPEIGKYGSRPAEQAMQINLLKYNASMDVERIKYKRHSEVSVLCVSISMSVSGTHSVSCLLMNGQ